MIAKLAEGVLAGQPRAIARAITVVESGDEAAAELVDRLRVHAGRGESVGLTGSPGVGKSSLIGKLARELRGRGKSVGILAVDPSSPFSGGAVLGDRIQMAEVTSDPGVFVRSMGSRGWQGGLASAVADAVIILKAAGKDVVLLETVGVGQAEMDVVGAVQTVILVLTAGMGGEIQSMKAGLLEVADIYVVNKADLDGAHAVARSLLVVAEEARGAWRRPVIRTSAVSGTGIAELADVLEMRAEYLSRRREMTDQEMRFTRKTIISQAGRQILGELESALDEAQLEQLAVQVVAGAIDPQQAGREAVRLFFATRHSPVRGIRPGSLA